MASAHDKTNITYHTSEGERRRENEHVVNTELIRRQHRLCLQHEAAVYAMNESAKDVYAEEVYLLMASPNSQ